MFLSRFKNDLTNKPVPQTEAILWLAEQHSYRSGIEKEKLVKMIERFGCGPSKIKQRRTWIPEFLAEPSEILFTKPSVKNEQPSMEDRMQVYQKQLRLAVKNLYKDNEATHPSHLLHVSCTGYASPSLAQELVIQKSWSTVVQHIYHMGCYAAIPAIRTAQGILKTEDPSQVEILHTEFCSLHLNLLSTTPEQLVVQSLFADACIAYQATAQEPKDLVSLRVLATHEMILPDSQQDMTWGLANFGLSMTLSREVPQKIAAYLPAFLKILFHKANLDISEMNQITAAIHPGGPKIIESVQDLLSLKDSQVAVSRKILFENGNMSSATMPFMWKEILENKELLSY